MDEARASGRCASADAGGAALSGLEDSGSSSSDNEADNDAHSKALLGIESYHSHSQHRLGSPRKLQAEQLPGGHTSSRMEVADASADKKVPETAAPGAADAIGRGGEAKKVAEVTAVNRSPQLYAHEIDLFGSLRDAERTRSSQRPAGKLCCMELLLEATILQFPQNRIAVPQALWYNISIRRSCVAEIFDFGYFVGVIVGDIFDMT
jgi:hypothetical protein